MSKRSMARLGLAGLAFLSMSGTGAAEPSSGYYGSLALAVRGDEVHGVFSQNRVGNGDVAAPQFSCIFLLKGEVTNGRATVETWFPGRPERISGVLDLGDDPSLRLTEDHGGCLMTTGDMTREPYRLDVDERHPEWIGVGLVTVPRVVLRPEPRDDTNRTRPYLVWMDTVAVLEQRDGWFRVAFLEGPPATGWVRNDEVTASAPNP